MALSPSNIAIAGYLTAEAWPVDSWATFTCIRGRIGYVPT